MKKTITALAGSIILVMLPGVSAMAEIKAVSVSGSVAYKEGQAWVPLKPGMALKEGSKVSTGVKSTAVIQVEDHTVTVRPLSMIKVISSKTSADSSSTGIGLKRGSLRATVNREKRVRTVFKVTTPIATSSVRGTDKIVSYGPMKGMIIRMLSGIAEGENKNGAKNLVAGKQLFQQLTGKPLPENILAEIKNGSMPSIFDKNITEKENANLDTRGDDLVESGNTSVNSVNNIQKQEGGGKASNKSNVNIQWP